MCDRASRGDAPTCQPPLPAPPPHPETLTHTPPRSEWSFDEYPTLWEPIACLLANVTYQHRINLPGGWGGVRVVEPASSGGPVQHLAPLPHPLPPLFVCTPENYNYCNVPQSAADAFLFVSLALLAASCLFGKLSAVWILIAGGWVGGGGGRGAFA